MPSRKRGTIAKSSMAISRRACILSFGAEAHCWNCADCDDDYQLEVNTLSVPVRVP